MRCGKPALYLRYRTDGDEAWLADTEPNVLRTKEKSCTGEREFVARHLDSLRWLRLRSRRRPPQVALRRSRSDIRCVVAIPGRSTPDCSSRRCPSASSPALS